eukprot:1064119-Pleurochrysis_carterae.AAC.5
MIADFCELSACFDVVAAGQVGRQLDISIGLRFRLQSAMHARPPSAEQLFFHLTRAGVKASEPPISQARTFATPGRARLHAGHHPDPNRLCAVSTASQASGKHCIAFRVSISTKDFERAGEKDAHLRKDFLLMVVFPLPRMTLRRGKEEEGRTTCSMRDSLASDETPSCLSAVSVGERCEGRSGSSSVLVVNIDSERLVLCAIAEGYGKNPTAHRFTGKILHNIAKAVDHDFTMDHIREACVRELERAHNYICSTSTERDDCAMVTVVVVNENRRKLAVANVGDLHVARILQGCDRVELLSEFLPQIKPHAQHLGILGAGSLRPKPLDLCSHVFSIIRPITSGPV